MDPRIFDRIEFCHRHSVSTLLSTNGTFLDEACSARVLDSPLEQITLSFDGFKKETFEFYRKGAKFEKVRDNFVRFARMKHERRSRLQVVVQMVKMDGNAAEVDDFLKFWGAIPGVDQLRIKADETNLMRPESGHAASDWKHPCHYLWRGRHVRQAEQATSTLAAKATCWTARPWVACPISPLTQIWNSPAMQDMRRLHASGRGGEVDICSRCCTTIRTPRW
jgi:molybdenum cofactor biosynthesis enzyme MoaA